jgi:hypothetical protein
MNKTETIKKTIKGYTIGLSDHDPQLWQRCDLLIELDENRKPVIVGYSWGKHDSKNMIVESVSEQMAKDVYMGEYR